jgi:hypothetical protein
MVAAPRSEALFALHRFGFGPRTGSAAAISADPRGALLADIERPGAAALTVNMSSSGEAARGALEEREARRAARLAREATKTANPSATLPDASAMPNPPGTPPLPGAARTPNPPRANANPAASGWHGHYRGISRRTRPSCRVFPLPKAGRLTGGSDSIRNCVAFTRSRFGERATLIQGRPPARNLDSKIRSSRFECCVQATSRRLLQHNRPEPDTLIAGQRVGSLGQTCRACGALARRPLIRIRPQSQSGLPPTWRRCCVSGVETAPALGRPAMLMVGVSPVGFAEPCIPRPRYHSCGAKAARWVP